MTAINAYDEHGIPASGNSGRFQYTGQAWLPDLGMYYYKARIYSPTLGRFLQTDPIGYGDGMNLYAYVGNDAVNGRDPTGLCTYTNWAHIRQVWDPSIDAYGPPTTVRTWVELTNCGDSTGSGAATQGGEGTATDGAPIVVTGHREVEKEKPQSDDSTDLITVTARPTPVYRAIDDFELTVMAANGMRFVPSPGGLEVKYFWPKPEYAFAFGKEYIRQGWVATPVHIVASTLPAGMNYSTVNVADLSRYGMGNVYAITVPNSDLYRIAPATVIGYVPFKR